MVRLGMAALGAGSRTNGEVPIPINSICNEANEEVRSSQARVR